MENETPSWTEMSNQLLNTWTAVGTQMWQGWFDMMGVAAKPPMTDMKVGLESVTERLVDNQQLVARLLRLSFNAWQEMLPKVESGADWQQSMNQYVQQIKSQVDEFSAGSLKINQDIAELWKLYLQETQKVSKLWVSSLGSVMSPLGQAAWNGGSEPWIELNNLYWNFLYEETFGSLMQSPLLGPTREFNGKLLRSFDAWTKLYRASIDYQVLLADIQVQSFDALMKDLVARAEKGEPVQEWRKFQQIWGQVADDVFEKAFCSEDNLKIRGRFLNALNTYRIHQQGLMEVWMKQMDLPVRSEVDEVHKSIYELRKEVKALKKALAKYESQETATPSAVSEPATESALASSLVTQTSETTPEADPNPVPEQSPESPAEMADASHSPSPGKTTSKSTARRQSKP
jgi:class III poly(R)-hydroxyalkanoic acid synthase PhaE subunit